MRRFHIARVNLNLCKPRTRLILALGVLVIIVIFPSLRCSIFLSGCGAGNTPQNIHPSTHKPFGKNTTGTTREKQGILDLNKTKTYAESLHDHANKDRVIILTTTDSSFIDLALNLYFTSFKPLNLSNYLYVSCDNEASKVLEENGIAHFTMFNSQEGKTSSDWGTSAFNRKTHIKTIIVHEALKLHYTVLFVDVDIIFLRNPFKFFSCQDCDIQITSDEIEGNSGFYLAKPTKPSITLHETALRMAKEQPKLSNQKTLDRTMESMQKARKIKYIILSVANFPNGFSYFEAGHRMFAGDNPCKTCVMIHNNWIVTAAAKEYRFKEHLMWFVDKNGYYSNKSAKYLVYENPFDFGASTTSIELNALKDALTLSKLLGRIVILPKFHCYGCKYDACKITSRLRHTMAHCSLNTHLHMGTFNKAFANAYREHVFLSHPLVPKEVISSQSPTILIKTNTIITKLQSVNLAHIKVQFTPKDLVNGPSSKEVLSWLTQFSDFKILHFHSMYNVIKTLDHQHKDNTFQLLWKKGIMKADYRQFK